MVATFACETAAAARASARRRARSTGLASAAAGSVLSATSRPRSTSSARCTTPMPPRPSGPRIRKCPSFCPRMANPRRSIALRFGSHHAVRAPVDRDLRAGRRLHADEREHRLGAVLRRDLGAEEVLLLVVLDAHAVALGAERDLLVAPQLGVEDLVGVDRR